MDIQFRRPGERFIPNKTNRQLANRKTLLAEKELLRIKGTLLAVIYIRDKGLVPFVEIFTTSRIVIIEKRPLFNEDNTIIISEEWRKILLSKRAEIANSLMFCEMYPTEIYQCSEIESSMGWYNHTPNRNQKKIMSQIKQKVEVTSINLAKLEALEDI